MTTRGYYFGPFRLDPEERALFRGPDPVPLTPKAFETLLFLIGKRGHIVEKEELMKALWPDTFVEDGSLGQQIFQLRKALGDGAGGAEYIATVPRRGYRFVAQVREGQDERLPRKRKAWLILAGCLGLAAAIAVIGWRAYRMPRVEIRSLAVLPLADLSARHGDDYFAEGMTKALIIDLSRMTHLRVVSRPSVIRYKASMKPPAEIARELRVDGLVIGSVLQADGRVRVTAQLIHPASDRQLWAESYERDMQDILSLQREVARAIAAEVRAKVAAPEASLRIPGRVTSEAYDQYLRGRFHYSRRTATDSLAAIAALERAVAIDTVFPAGHAALAQAYLERFYSHAPEEQEQLEKKAWRAVEQALTADPDLPEAYVARALLLWSAASGYAHERAIHDLRRAAAADPNSVEAHRVLSRIYNHVGYPERGLAEAQTAMSIGPAEALPLWELSQSLLWLGRYEEGLSALSGLPRDLFPPLATAQMAWALLQLGRPDRAMEKIDEFSKAGAPDMGGALASMRALLLAAQGRAAEAEVNIAKAVRQKALVGHFHHSAHIIASAYARMGRPQHAVRWLEDAARSGFPCYPLFERDRQLDPLRSDARFLAFMAKLRRDWQRLGAVVN